MVLISRWSFSTQRMGNQVPCTLQLCQPTGSWWKWRRECRRDTLVPAASAWKHRSSLSLLSCWWEFIPERGPAARRVRNLVCGWAATTWLQLRSMEKEERWKWHLATAIGGIGNARISCVVSMVFTVSYQRNKEETFQIVLFFFLQDLILSPAFFMEPP